MKFDFELNIFDRLKILRVITVIGLLFSILCSYPLWFGQRWAPCIPFQSWASIPVPYDGSLFFLEVVLILLSFYAPRPRLVMFLIFLLNMIYVLLDLTRLQSWFY